MSHLTGKERSEYVQTMFGKIAHRYDLLNGIMTFGQDARWRKEAVRRLEIKPNSIILDLGTGTGDIAIDIARKYPDALVVGGDFTPEMLAVAINRPWGDRVQWLIADVQHLPFAKESVSSVISSFLLRNVSDVSRTLEEHHRTLIPGGRVVSLDTTPPQRNLLHPFIEFHLRIIIPLLGKFIARDGESYAYLPSSTEGFLPAETLAERFRQAGFSSVSFIRRMLGTVSIHWGEKGDL